MPAKLREALSLVDDSGLSYEEAAKISGCAIGTVKSRVHRARGHLSLTRIRIDLSPKSMQAIAELQNETDAVTVSDVFRNALRLHLTLVRGHKAGARLFMKRDGGDHEPVEIFAPDAEEAESR